MRTHEEFESWLSSTLLPQLAAERRAIRDLEDRKRAVELLRSTKVTMIAIGVLIAGVLRSSELFAVAVVLPFALDLLRRKRIQGAPCNVRTKFLEPVVRFFDPSFEYAPWAGLKRAEVLDTELFEQGFNDVQGHDRVQGRVGETAFRCCQLTLRRYHGNQPPEILFTGILLEADLRVPLRGSVRVLPVQSDADLDPELEACALGPDPAFEGHAGSLVDTRDAAFARVFVTYADDEREARQLLSADLRERLVVLQRDCGRRVRLALRDGRLCMALGAGRDFSVARGGVLSLDDGTFRAWSNDLRTITSLVQDLDGLVSSRRERA